MLNVGLSPVWLVAFLLGMARSVAWVYTAPPFSNSSVPGPVKMALSLALTMAVLPKLMTQAVSIDTSTKGLVLAVGGQVLVGAGLGFLVRVILSAIEMAGDLLDVNGGLSLASAFDPLAMNQNAVLAKLNSAVGTTLLLVSGLHLVVLAGYWRTFDLLPVNQTLDLARYSSVLTVGITQLVATALQIAGPLLAVLFVADVSLGVMSRISPQLQPFALSFPIKIGIVLMGGGLLMTTLPQVVQMLVERVLSAMGTVLGV